MQVAAKQAGLGALEAAMLRSTLHNSKGVTKEMEREGAARTALRKAAVAKQAKGKKPTYTAAMMKFTTRLNAKEQHQVLFSYV